MRRMTTYGGGLRFVQIEYAPIVEHHSGGDEDRPVLYGLDQQGRVWHADISALKGRAPGVWRLVRDDFRHEYEPGPDAPPAED